MHISILPMAFEALQLNFLEVKGNSARMNTPLDQLALIKTQLQEEEIKNALNQLKPHILTSSKMGKSVKLQERN